MSRVLIVDDEPQILRALRINLQARDYEVTTATNGAEALREARSSRPDVVVLDLGLPDIDGVEVIRALRAWTPVPIVVLSGRITSNDKVDALDAGADDYVTKPFNLNELLARIRAVSRRHPDQEQITTVDIGRFRVDFQSHTITATDDPTASVRLTRTEWQILHVLATNTGRLVSHRELLHTVWGPTYGTETHYLRQFMTGIRRKLETDPSHPRHLLTEPGMGYRFLP
jgi:two-component system, OmpR family, KDP operon response regulator KdpE